MKAQVHNKRERLARLIAVLGNPRSFQVSDVKRDDTVIVRFLSTDSQSAIEATEAFRDQLNERRTSFVQVDDVRIRLHLPE